MLYFHHTSITHNFGQIIEYYWLFLWLNLVSSCHSACCCASFTVLALCAWCVCAAAKPGGRIRCQYFPAVDKVLFVDDYAVGCRKDLNGILLLDTALQPPVAKPDDVVQLELPVTEVSAEQEHGERSVSSFRAAASQYFGNWAFYIKF